MKLLATQSARFHFTLSSARSFSTPSMKRCASFTVGGCADGAVAGCCCAPVAWAQMRAERRTYCREERIMGGTEVKGRAAQPSKGRTSGIYTLLDGQISATTHASHRGARAS